MQIYKNDIHIFVNTDLNNNQIPDRIFTARL